MLCAAAPHPHPLPRSPISAASKDAAWASSLRSSPVNHPFSFAMNSPERMPAETHKPFTGYLWGTLAVLTCPCHLSILAAVLAGTTAGAFLVEYWVITALGLTGLFLLSLARALRAFRERS